MITFKSVVKKVNNLFLFERVKNLFNGHLKENIFYLHIPKCGGASIRSAIMERYLTLNIKKDNQFIALDPATSSRVVSITNQTQYPYNTNDNYPILKLREDLLLYFMCQNKKYILGHFTFSELAYREFHKNYVFITVLRDPIKRLISSYFYNKHKTQTHCRIEEDFDTFLQSHFGKSQGYEYVKFIGGADKLGDYTSKHAIDRAKENLHKFDIVGCLEYQDIFLKQFEERFSIRLKLNKKNESPVSESYRKSIVTEEIKEKIKEICKPDLEIYQYAINNFVKSDC